MNRPKTSELLIFISLVTCGVLARVALQHIPNFAPVAAVALFAGYLFGNRALALLTPLAIMFISDRLIDAGSYNLVLMCTVYGLLALPVVISMPLRRHLTLSNHTASRAFGTVLGLVSVSLACSLLFFAGTNFMVWCTSAWYEPTLAGLTKCYVSAIPFFRYTVTGDAVFSTVLFGSYALWTQRAASVLRPAHV